MKTTPDYLHVSPDKLRRKIGVERKAVVYLDQGVLSALARRRLRLERDPARIEALTQLDVALCAAVKEDRAICVESWIHREESSPLAHSPHNDLFRTINELMIVWTFGLYLQHDIMMRQVQLATVQKLGRWVMPADKLYFTGLGRDPDRPIKSIAIGGGIVAGIEWRAVATRPPGFGAALTARRHRGEFGTYAQELARGRDEFRAVCLADHDRADWSFGFSSRPSERISRSEVTDFLRSDDVFKLPYAAVSLRLHARLLSDTSRKEFRDSDFQDIAALNRALPYCDLVVHDGYMVQQVKATKLDAMLNVTVLSAATRDIAAATEWLRNIPPRACG
jgi:hypothetical protein